ncbi:ThiF family adenylyltransferase [Mycetocola sp. 2940]|uniref:ThiF family adenylyltransferase n=1 Tax=Mycetocola sp. 2940 TaxID=3156452 RepID=UPI003396D860
MSPFPASRPVAAGERYRRQTVLPEVGTEGQARIAAARVLVVGAGGLGSPLLISLAAAGIGTIGVLDDDVVELSNLARQVVHRSDDVGEAKTVSAARTLASVNPDVTVIQHRLRLTRDNALAVTEGYDVIVDGTDTFETHYAVADAAALRDVPLVWGSVLRFDGMVSVFHPGSGAGAPGFRDLFPDESAAGTAESCELVGVLGTSCAIVAGVMAAEVMKLVVGFGEPLIGRVLVVDALTSAFREIPLRAGGAPRHPPTSPTAGRVTAAEFDELRANGQAVTVIDVREPGEHLESAIPGSVNIPRNELAGAVSGLDADVPIVVYCETGVRSAVAAAYLNEHGHPARNLDGGIRAWLRRQPPANGGSTSS